MGTVIDPITGQMYEDPSQGLNPQGLTPQQPGYYGLPGGPMQPPAANPGLPAAPAFPVPQMAAMAPMTGPGANPFAAPAQPQRDNYQYMDPRRALWAGTLSDIGNYIGSGGMVPMQGLGQRYMAQAEAMNRQITSGRQQEELNQRQLNRKENPWAEFPAAEQEYQAFLEGTGLEDTPENRQMFANFNRTMTGGTPAKIQQYERYLTDVMGVDPDEASAQQKAEAWSRGNSAPFDWRREMYYGSGWDEPGMQQQISTLKRMGINTQDKAALLTDTLPTLDSAIDRLTALRAQVEAGPETGPMSEYLQMFDPYLQDVQQQYQTLLLDKVAAARAGGVTFGQMTEGEWARMAKTGPQLTNRKSTNLAILDRLIAQEQKRRDRYYTDLDAYSMGQYPTRGPRETGGDGGGGSAGGGEWTME